MVLPCMPTTYVPSSSYSHQSLINCRSAYTSLLRITTTLPPKEENEAKAEDAREANPQTNDGNNPTTMSRLATIITNFRSRAEQLTPSELERGNGAGN